MQKHDLTKSKKWLDDLCFRELSREFTTRSKTVCYRRRWNKLDIVANGKLHVCLSKQSYSSTVAKIWEWDVSPWCNLQDGTLRVAVVFSCRKNQCRLPSRSSFLNWGRNKRKHNSSSDKNQIMEYRF